MMSYGSWEKKKKKPVLERLLEHSFPLFSTFTLYILAMHALLEMLSFLDLRLCFFQVLTQNENGSWAWIKYLQLQR